MSKSRDPQHLDILSIFHYVVGGILYVFGLFPMIHPVMGLFMRITSFTEKGEPGIAFIGLLFTLFSPAFTLST